METESETKLTLLEFPDMPDVRGLTVIWGDGDPRPEIEWFNCSVFEALGFAQAAVRYLESEAQLDPDPEEDEDDDGYV